MVVCIVKFQQEEPYDPWVRWTLRPGTYLDIICEFSFAGNYVSRDDDNSRLPSWWFGATCDVQQR